MPSPVGHALGGLAAGWLVAGAPARPATSADPWIATWRGALVFAMLGMLPDIDLLVGAHSMHTHSIGAALIVTLATIALTRSPERLVAGLAAGAAYGSHILFDWMGNDTTPPIGIMALWPFSSDYYESDVHWFMAITRRYWLPNFWWHNTIAMLREVGTLTPLVLLIYWLRRRRAPARHA